MNDLERVVSYCRGKDCYLNLLLVYKTDLDSFVTTTDSSDIENWKSKGKIIYQLLGVKNSSGKLPSIIISSDGKNSIKLTGNYFKQTKVDYTRSNVINIYVVYVLSPRNINEDCFVQVNALFGNFKLGETADTLKYRYYDGIGVFLFMQLENMTTLA